MIVAKMEEFVRNKLITIYSKRLLDEMNTFVWQHGKPQAMKKYNDDLIMACAIGCWVRDTALTENKKSVEYRKAFLNTMTKSSSILDTTVRGMNNYKPGQDMSDAAKAHKKTIEMYPWLFKG